MYITNDDRNLFSCTEQIKWKIRVSHWTCWEHLTKIKEQYLDCFECIMIYISLHHKKLRHKTDLEWALRGTVVNQNNKQQSMLFNVKTRHIDCIIIYTWMFIQSYDTQYPRVHADKKSWTCDSKRKPFLALFCCMIYNSQMIRSVYYKFFVRKDMIAFVNVFEMPKKMY